VTISVTIPVGVAVCMAVALVLFGTYLYAVRARWFARLYRGFFYTFLLAVVGAGVITAAILVVWFYDVGREIVFKSVVNGMRNMGDIIEGEVHEEVARGRTMLLRLADRITLEMVRERPDEVRALLGEIQRVDPRFLQLNVFDQQGTSVLVSGTADQHEPPDRMGLSHALAGQPFVSHPYVSPVFDRYVLYLAAPLRGATTQNTGALTARWDLQNDLTGLLAASRFNRTGRMALLDGEGRVMADPDPARIRNDVAAHPAVREALQGKAGWIIVKNGAGEAELVAYRPVPAPTTLGGKPWVLLSQERASDALAAIHELWDDFAIGLTVVLVLCLVAATHAAVGLRRPLDRLLGFVHAVQGGDLTRRLGLSGRDEIGRLAIALNGMVEGLQERERVKEVFGRYVTTQVSQEILKGEINLGGQRRRITMLFSDIRDFTAMSESMSPEQVVGFLNEYFTEMVDAVFDQQGVLDKFIGDGMMALFGSLDEAPDHPRRAVRAALRMKALVAKINGERGVLGQAAIAIGIGIHTDDVIVGNIGSRKRLEYTAIGDGVNTCSRVEALNKEFGTTILITESTFGEVADEFDCRPLPEVALRGKTKIPRVFEVLSARGKTTPS
jgi:class 3 adenylate cyclase